MSTPPTTPVVLIVRDGWGQNPNESHADFNAVALARTPVDDRLTLEWPRTLVRTCGVDVGLPAGTMGNSEVGHQNIGAGRIVDQEVQRINRAIEDESFFEMPALVNAFEHARSGGGRLHLMGLLSDGLVHSDLDHLLALLEMGRRRGFPADRLFIHVFTDGRDTSPMGGRDYIKRLEKGLGSARVGRIVSVVGRFYAMDRDNRWDRVARAYGVITGRGAGAGSVGDADTAIESVEAHYANPAVADQTGDEFVPPTRIGDPAGKARLADGDSVIFYNFRGDRPRQLTRAIMLDDEAWAAVPRGGFDRGKRLRGLYYCTMTGYESGLPVSGVAFEKPAKMPDILGEVVSSRARRQFRCAETEKYAHVTFFFNDYREDPFEGEDRLLVPSPTEVETYDKKPEMSAEAVCAGVLEQLDRADPPGLIVVNFANADMVGHTGKLDAVVSAVETVDACVGRIVERTLECGGALLITADHGNAEQMWNPDLGVAHTAHTTYDVPLSIVGERWRGAEIRTGGRLADIAPTVLKMMDIDRPAAMTGASLV
ncbi:MAG: 2,3-bisphosphoglycerate-independent phosphoglycerate mutase [Planctomycetota bacterium]|jgi:2,3-bisphosphoglycerate-independent phosphoglycerate mutase